MGTISQDQVLQSLRTVKYPGYSRDIVSFGLIKEIQVDGSAVGVLIELTTPNRELGEKIADAARLALRDQIPGLSDAHVQLRVPVSQSDASPGASTPASVGNVKRWIAVASGKGGVGKSTCAVNLACAMAHKGFRVGLMDADIYGPSIPLMMGNNERPTLTEDERLVPPVAHGVKLMSMGLLVGEDQAVVWRGPMIQKTIQQFVHLVDWGALDYLFIDLPPGTGDAQLSLCQTVPLDGGVIVSTPQLASLGVVRKGMAMFEKVHVPLLGLIENMSGFVTPEGVRVDIFGHGGARHEAERKGIPFLGEVPLMPAIREGGDSGVPIVVGAPNSEAARAFLHIANALDILVRSTPLRGNQQVDRTKL